MKDQLFFVSEILNSVVASVEKYTFIISIEMYSSERTYNFKMYFEEDANGNSATFERNITKDNELQAFLQVFLSEFILEKENLKEILGRVIKMLNR
ncbi:hypothetical protein BCJMU51_5476 [Bacillus cereus]|uniref:hypothetical protein n=1 Tax=Bacillus cereus TaxID=1396 RepID=UPI001F217F56|nr:hypothetical protein [Bacillus cereus]BCB40558.1 hypothetical protein BCM0045_5453 [Bacillus cereus]BCC03394.1 hypothetical protein BCM0057_5476 [Bacillus cereus]BCC26913.1 hypothetical protein BCM0079_5506 [Bacillus cereus]BCC38473.1 hypothetical protein BCM0105_5463 [Bacillus cereus]BCC44271.1 hypothetical protein BCJMU01_5438 [Bacillus cereus]